jgi:hypothetical protein
MRPLPSSETWPTFWDQAPESIQRLQARNFSFWAGVVLRSIANRCNWHRPGLNRKSHDTSGAVDTNPRKTHFLTG